MDIANEKLVTILPYQSEYITSLPSIERMDQQVEQVENILGLDFYILKDFFNDILFEINEETCTIFITRRCALLAEFFLRYFAETTDNRLYNSGSYSFYVKNGIKNYILSDKPDIDYIIKLCGKNNIKKINIVDDICIHGNTLDRTLKYIKKYIKDRELNCKVVTWAYMYSHETTVIIPDAFRKVSYDASWLNLSEKIVKVIRTLNFPYVSFINAYETLCDENDFRSFIGTLTNNRQLIHFHLGYYEDEESRNKDTFFIVEKQLPIYEEVEALKCVRLYFSESLNSLVVVPYVILKSLTAKENATPDILLDEFKKLVSLYLKADCVFNLLQLIKNHVDLERDDSRLGSFLYCMASCIASQAYGNYFFTTYLHEPLKNFNNWKSDCINSVLNSFGQEISNIIQNESNYLEYKNYIIEKLEKESIDVSNQQACEDLYQKCEESWYNYECPSFDSVSEFKLKDLLEKKSIDNGIDNIGYNYAYLLNLIKLCDAGVMAIACTKTYHESFIKSGELGCLVVSKLLYRNGKIDDNLSKLLESNFYYRYLIL